MFECAEIIDTFSTLFYVIRSSVEKRVDHVKLLFVLPNQAMECGMLAWNVKTTIRANTLQNKPASQIINFTKQYATPAYRCVTDRLSKFHMLHEVFFSGLSNTTFGVKHHGQLTLKTCFCSPLKILLILYSLSGHLHRGEKIVDPEVVFWFILWICDGARNPKKQTNK